VVAPPAGVGYPTGVVARARRWLTIAGIGVATACTSAAAPPRPPTVEPAAAPPPVPVPPAEPVTEPVTEPPCPPDPERDPNQKPEHVLQLVELADAMTVVDLGSGDGYFLCRLAHAVGPRGRVVATELGKRRLDRLEQRVAREQLANVEVVAAPVDDVGVPAGSADRILLVNVWHHLRKRERYAARIARALAPGGKVIVVDFPRGRGRGKHGIAPERVLAELAAGGFDAELVPDELTGQYVIIGRAAAR
jgi:predicted methyltransferase